MWGDLLTAYDGQGFEYDAIGNPTSYYNGTRWSFEWEHGRELATATSGTTTSASYTYDADGLRTSKTVNGVVYNYYYSGSKLVRLTYGDYVLDFFYDAMGTPIAMRQGYASSSNYVVYYYITNLQGDVIRLVDFEGNTAAYYEYDPYGNAIQASGSHATINPLRYRGYVYDTETGFYYLQSRYYDPQIGRFINADILVSTGQGILGNNMFAYCNNNPVNFCDPCGTCIHRWDFWNDCEKCEGPQLKNALTFVARLLLSPLSAIDAEVSVGVGYGGSIGAIVDGVTVNVSAEKTYSDSLSFADGQFDLGNKANESIGLEIAGIDFAHSEGTSHSFFDEACTCTFRSTFGEKSNCPANQSFSDSSTTWGVSGSLYVVLGAGFSVGIDMQEWLEELIDIYKYGLSLR